jgi:nucleoside-diphosphate-sugar epimerase
MNENAMQILLIGGTGFVGRAVVRHFAQAGYALTLLNRGSVLVAGADQITADRNDASAMTAALSNRQFDAVIDTNCYTAEQAEILLSAVAVPRIAMISSAAVYANRADTPPDEAQPVGGAPIWSTYGTDKAKAEGVYRAAAGRFESCSIFRPPYIFGFGNSHDRETWFWTRQLNAAPILLPGDGTTPVQFIHDADLAAAIATVVCGARRGLDIFNVADPEVLTFSTLVSLLAKVANRPDLQIPVGEAARGAPARSWFPFRDYPCLTDPAGLIRETGWTPEAGLAERFAETFAAYDPARLKAALNPTETETAMMNRLRSP